MVPLLQLRIKLLGISPLIWRRILIHAGSTFWDLHIAILGAMGWEDRRRHRFEVFSPVLREVMHYGIPDPEKEIHPSWRQGVSDDLRDFHDAAFYDHDAGWRHLIVLEDHGIDQKDRAYPLCIDGAGRCPPEDCGGPDGYERFLAAINDPAHEDHERLLQRHGGPFDPNDFDPAKVTFADPQARLGKLT